MMLEISVFRVRAAKEEVFAKAFRDGWKKLGTVKGVEKWRLFRAVGEPARFVFTAEWKSLEDHQALAKTPGYGALLAAIGPYLEGSPEIGHYQPV